MYYGLRQWEWHDNAFKIPEAVSLIDLSKNGDMIEGTGGGWCVVAQETPIGSIGYDFGQYDNISEILVTESLRDACKTLFGVRPVGENMGQLILNALSLLADDKGVDTAKPIRIQTDGQLPLWFENRQVANIIPDPTGTLNERVAFRRQFLRIQKSLNVIRDAVYNGNLPPDTHRKLLVVEAIKLDITPETLKPDTWLADETPIMPSTDISDNFANSTNWTNRGPDSSWTASSNTFQIAAENTFNWGSCQNNTVLSSVDHYAECIVTTTSSTKCSDYGPIARMGKDGSNRWSGYCSHIEYTGYLTITLSRDYYGPSSQQGSRAYLNNVVDPNTTTRTLRVTCNGSSITRKCTGISDVTVTDTNYNSETFSGTTDTHRLSVGVGVYVPYIASRSPSYISSFIASDNMSGDRNDYTSGATTDNGTYTSGGTITTNIAPNADTAGTLGFLRIPNITLTAAETLTGATLTLLNYNTGALTITVKGFKTANPSSPTNGANASTLPSTLTTASVTKVISGDSSQRTHTFNILDIVNELRAQVGWATGNAMMFQVSCSDGSTTFQNKYGVAAPVNPPTISLFRTLSGGSISSSPAVAADDGTYTSGGTLSTSGQIVADNLGTLSWVRFPNITLGNAASFLSSTLELTSSSASSVGAWKIEGFKTANPSAPTNGANSSTLPATLTTAKIYPTSEYKQVGEKILIDISTILTELIAQGGWTSGNAIMLKISSTTYNAVDGQFIGYGYENGSNLPTLRIKYAVVAPVVTGGSTSGTVGTAFSYQIQATNSPTSYSASGLPSGLVLDTNTGVISGTPVSAGVSSVTIGASNSAGSDSKTLTITIASATPSITSTTSGSCNQGSIYTYNITGSNSPTAYFSSTLPGRLTLNTSTGLISGLIPIGSYGNYTYTIGCSNVAGSGSATFSLTVSKPDNNYKTTAKSGYPVLKGRVAIATSTNCFQCLNTTNSSGAKNTNVGNKLDKITYYSR